MIALTPSFIRVVVLGAAKRSIWVAALAIGETQASITRDVGLDRSQVCRFSRREEIKPFTEQEQMKLIEAVPDALENVRELVREMKDIPKKDIKRRELAYKASMDTLKAVGIMPSPVQSLLVTNNPSLSSKERQSRLKPLALSYQYNR